MTTAENKTRLIGEYNESIKKVNAACLNGTAQDVEKAQTELSAIESEYFNLVEKETFASCETTRDALALHHFETISHKAIREDGRMVGVEATNKTVVIDMKKYCEQKSLALNWYYNMQALNKRLTLRQALNLGCDAQAVKEINGSYSMDALAAEIALGKTPTSNTQVVKHIQSVLDELCPDLPKANNKDLAYIDACYAKRSTKRALAVGCANHKSLMTLITDVGYRLVTGGVYSVDYKKADGSAASIQGTKPAETAETVETENEQA